MWLKSLKIVLLTLALSLSQELVYSATYQDIIVNGETVSRGTNICPPRYDLIKPILDQYKGTFNVLDIGSAQGYFSLRIAHEFPLSKCVMIEGEEVYRETKGRLHRLCLQSDRPENLFFLNKHVTLNDLRFLNKHDHFDVVLAFLVLHQIQESVEVPFEELLKLVLKLGDNVIVELSDDVSPELLNRLQSVAKKHNCTYLGELQRRYDSTVKGYFYHFKLKTLTAAELERSEPVGISKDSRKRLNGIFPTL